MAKLTQEQIVGAVKEVFGDKAPRASDAALLEAFGNYRGGVERLKRDMAASPLAAKRGVDGTKFGVEYVDFEKASEKDKEFLSAYQRVYGKNAQMSQDELRNWRQNGSPELLEAESRGDVKVDMGDDKRRTVRITADAWKKYGAGLLTGLHKNEAVVIEKGGASEDEVKSVVKGVSQRWRLYRGKETQEGGQLADQYVFTKDPKAHSGVVGSVAKGVGLSKGTANSLDRAAGQVAALGTLTTAGALFGDEAAAIGGGSRGVEERTKTFTRAGGALGLSKKDAGRLVQHADLAGDLVSGVAAGMADAGFLGAPVFSSLNQAANTLEASQQGSEVDWERQGRDLATTWITYGAGKGLGKLALASGGWQSARAAAGVQALSLVWGRGGQEAFSAALRGDSLEEIAMAGGAGFLLSHIPEGALGARSAASFAATYASLKQRGYSDDEALVYATTSAASTYAGSKLVASAKTAQDPTYKPSTDWTEPWRQDRQQGSAILQAARGTMPEAWIKQTPGYRKAEAELRRASDALSTQRAVFEQALGPGAELPSVPDQMGGEAHVLEALHRDAVNAQARLNPYLTKIAQSRAKLQARGVK